VTEETEVLAIIPARGGSKGLAQKNICELGGKPLIAHTIHASVNSRNISRTIVSTDCEQIAEVSKKYGAEVPFLRTDAHSGDKASVAAAIHECQKSLELRERYIPHIVIILFCTSPFRPPGMIDFLIEKIRSGYKNAYTAKRVSSLGNRYYHLSGNLLKRMDASSLSALPDGTPMRRYGLFYGFSNGNKPKDTFVYQIDNPVYLIDIDTQLDLEIARLAIAKGLIP
jgi:CMP-N-acetylneuraminic acid synthetase